MNQPCRTLSSLEMSNIPRTNESCHIYERVMSHAYNTPLPTAEPVMLHTITHRNKSCHVYEWVMSVTSHTLTHRNESRHTYNWVMSHIWLIRFTHPESCHTNPLHTPLPPDEQVMSCHTHDRVVSHIIHSWHRPSKSETCHNYEWFISHVRVSHVTLTNTNESFHTYVWVMSHVRISHVTPHHRDHIQASER